LLLKKRFGAGVWSRWSRHALLLCLDTIPEHLGHNAQLWDIDDHKVIGAVGSGSALFGHRMGLVIQPVPHHSTDVGLFVQDAGATSLVAIDCRGAPTFTSRPRNALFVECLSNFSRRHAIGIVTENSANDLSLLGDCLSMTRLNGAIGAWLFDNPVTVRFSSTRQAFLDAASKPAPCLVAQLIVPLRPTWRSFISPSDSVISLTLAYDNIL